MVPPLRGQGSHLSFLIWPKNTSKFKRTLLHFKFRCIGEVKKCLNRDLGAIEGVHLWFLIGHNLNKKEKDVKYLLHLKFRNNPFSICWEEVKKLISRKGAPAAIFVFPSARKHTNYVEDVVQYLLSIKFHQHPFSGCRRKLKMSQPIRGPGLPSLFVD